MIHDPNFEVQKRFHFHAAHRNVQAGEKCANLHGHTYHAQVTFQGPYQADRGLTVPFADFDKLIDEVKGELDHTTLLYERDELCVALASFNETATTPTRVVVFPWETSAENLAAYLAQALQDPRWLVTRVELRETETSTVIFTP